MLTSFGVLDTRNHIVWTINDFFYRITEPALRPIRNMLPNFGGIDLSPWVLVVLLIIAEELLMPDRAGDHFRHLAPAVHMSFWRAGAGRRDRDGEGAAAVAPARGAGGARVGGRSRG